MLIFLVVIFLAVDIAYRVLATIVLEHIIAEELILSGTFTCEHEFQGDFQLLCSMFWTPITVWEVLVLCLSLWITVKHFHDLRKLGPLTGSTIGDCFKVLITLEPDYKRIVSCTVKYLLIYVCQR
ncbi:hypothetical protein BDR04DRAFT_42506 [Suillus decipiens]|nr:hypothetical protein BDR04DRAFT_42506 [Suillus decipiens]